MTDWLERPEGRERCECGAWDEDHLEQCRDCGDVYTSGHRHQIGILPRVIYQWLCPDGNGGEFRRAVRPSHDD